MASSLTSLAILLLLQWIPLVLGFHAPHQKHGHIEGYHAFKTPRSSDESDPFHRNHLVKVSWDDPRLLERLWDGNPVQSRFPKSEKASSIHKRASGERTVMPGSWPQTSHCLGCFKSTIGDDMTIGDLSTEWLVTQMLVEEKDVEDRCVFYTGVPDSQRPTWLPGRTNLSPGAARWACDRGLVTLWSLFPGRDANVAPPGTTPEDGLSHRNFWEIDVAGSWLSHLNFSPVRFTYFENMSRAMARICGGKVWVWSLDPENLPYYGSQKPLPSEPNKEVNNNGHSIWNTVEYPELKAQGKTTTLIGVDADTGKMYRLSMSDQSVIGPYIGTVPREIQNLLSKRNTCLENLQYQTPGDDWFGTGRRSSGL